MSGYNFNIREFYEKLPPVLKKIRLRYLLNVLLRPLRSVWSWFESFRAEKEKRLSYTGQVYSLEKLIRKYCKNDGCRIGEGEYVEEVFVPYNDDGGLANYQVLVPYDGTMEPQVSVMYLGFGQIRQNDFIVYLPKDLQGNVDEAGLRKLIDEYKIAGKFYEIVYE